ncbi:MAG: hypothetical protein SNJ63_07470, partial [Sphingomonadaceae bacterium]
SFEADGDANIEPGEADASQALDEAASEPDAARDAPPPAAPESLVEGEEAVPARRPRRGRGKVAAPVVQAADVGAASAPHEPEPSAPESVAAPAAADLPPAEPEAEPETAPRRRRARKAAVVAVAHDAPEAVPPSDQPADQPVDQPVDRAADQPASASVAADAELEPAAVEPAGAAAATEPEGDRPARKGWWQRTFGS